MGSRLKLNPHWYAPDDWLKIKTIDVHTEGEPLRIILNGFPDLTGESILEKRRNAKEQYDHLRTALMWEPRGHADMYGCIITPAVTETADFGVLFTHNEGFSSMCGHGIIGVTKVVLETGMLPIQTPESVVKIDTPAGLVTAYARITGNHVSSVYFQNVPSFVFALDQSVEVPGIGRVNYDLAFGGAFYAFVQAESLGISLTPDNYRNLIESGMRIKSAVADSNPVKHPFEHDLSFLYGTIFVGPPETASGDSRNVCIFAEGEVDRSPTGTGVSARMALHYTRREFGVGETMIIESILGTTFSGRVVKSVKFGLYDAVIPEVEGTAFITGKHEFLVEPDDPLKGGFILR